LAKYDFENFICEESSYAQGRRQHKNLGGTKIWEGL